MTIQEFSNQFDTLVSSYRRFKSFDMKEELDSIEFDEYEKSVFLTMAQEEIVVSLYTGRNASGRAFEETEELRRYLESLVKTEAYSTTINADTQKTDHLVSTSVFFELPDDLMFIIMEQVKLNDSELGCASGSIADVVPVTHDEYLKIRKNPFRGTNANRALRLDAGEGDVEIISKYSFDTYTIRYISKPTPIIVEDLPDGVSVEGESNESECSLPEPLHKPILELAVQKALASKGLTLHTNN